MALNYTNSLVPVKNLSEDSLKKVRYILSIGSDKRTPVLVDLQSLIGSKLDTDQGPATSGRVKELVDQAIRTKSIKGVQGPKGLQGVKGRIGDDIRGDRGLTGIQGPKGVQGLRGTDAVGPQGVQGPRGPQGRTGLPGDAGDDSVITKGVQGLQGLKGTSLARWQDAPVDIQNQFKGNRGPAGDAGVQGYQGETKLLNNPNTFDNLILAFSPLILNPVVTGQVDYEGMKINTTSVSELCINKLIANKIIARDYRSGIVPSGT